QLVRPPAPEHVAPQSRLRSAERAGPAGRGDGGTPGTAQEPGDRQSLSGETLDATLLQLLRAMAQRRDELTRGFVASAPAPQTAVDDFLQVVAAGQPPDIFAAHGTRDVPAPQHRGE